MLTIIDARLPGGTKLALIVASALLLSALLVLAMGPRPPPPAEAVSREGKTARWDIGPRTVKVQTIKRPFNYNEIDRIPPMPQPMPEPPNREVRLWWPPQPTAGWPGEKRPTQVATAAPEARTTASTAATTAKKPAAKKPDDVCGRHKMRKVMVSAKKWRCKK